MECCARRIRVYRQWFASIDESWHILRLRPDFRLFVQKLLMASAFAALVLVSSVLLLYRHAGHISQAVAASQSLTEQMFGDGAEVKLSDLPPLSPAKEAGKEGQTVTATTGKNLDKAPRDSGAQKEEAADSSVAEVTFDVAKGVGPQGGSNWKQGERRVTSDPKTRVDQEREKERQAKSGAAKGRGVGGVKARVLLQAPPAPEGLSVPKLVDEVWAQMHTSFYDSSMTADRFDVVFAGDSITEGWGETFKGSTWSQYKGANATLASLLSAVGAKSSAVYAIAGDKVENLRWRLTNEDTPEIPKKLDVGVLVMNIGINNVLNSDQNSSAVVAQILGLVDVLRADHPKMQILLLGLLPESYSRNVSESTLTKPQPRSFEVNKMLAAATRDADTTYLDCSTAFYAAGSEELDPALFVKETFPLLHLTAAGYAAWAKCIQPTLTAAVAKISQIAPGPSVGPGTNGTTNATAPVPPPVVGDVRGSRFASQ